MSFVSNIVGGVLGANAAGNAASAEVQGAKEAQGLEYQNQQDALNMQKGVWSGTQSAESPYQSLGSTSANSLRDLLSKGFSAPNPNDVASTPEYQFALGQGTNAIDQNAAANGTLMSGNTGVALQKYGQGLASTTYNDAYQHALGSYMANLQGLTTGTQAGLTSTGQLGQFGQEAANNTGNIDLTGADQQAKQINNAAAARASGYMGEAAGWGQMAGGIMSGVGAFLPGGGGLSGLLKG